MINFYDVLGLSVTATPNDIRKAYKAKALQHHPDKNLSNKEEATEKFKQAAEAYSILSDENSRKQYDKEWMRESTVTAVPHKQTRCNQHQQSHQTRSNESYESHHDDFTAGRAFDIFDMLFGKDGINFTENGDGKLPKKRRQPSTGDITETSNDHMMEMMMMCASSHYTLGRVHRGPTVTDETLKSSNGVVHIIVQPDGSMAHVELVTPGRSQHWHRHRSNCDNGLADVTMASQWASYHSTPQEKPRGGKFHRSSSHKISFTAEHTKRESGDVRETGRHLSLQSLGPKNAMPSQRYVKNIKRKIGRRSSLERSGSMSMSVNSKGIEVPVHVDKYRPKVTKKYNKWESTRSMPQHADHAKPNNNCICIRNEAKCNRNAKRESAGNNIVLLLKRSISRFLAVKVGPSEN